ncbi:RND transporter [Chroococcidiopsis cubana SAG 39.79]|uniref:RND transporter n=1 Tax=Chroococcidiopsis cubana SAG 39.79 TaxID=388085 RepID=A0AB37UNN7_9CYAN|nr:efflux RND transporter periplasmic adaptor subunit [Chroococcidiopsis cubana]PSB61692.1 efflux transporter periplasmic adaptor subunit [Chroococcidiopsis cubana CCALA 043]RUT12792.1 RND transporter [Chroococcidiopsis cubana SAG 39.79]
MTATQPIELPLIGKIKHPARWLVRLVAAGVVVAGSATYVIVDRSTPKIDLAKLTVPVEAKDLTLRINASGKVVPIQSVNVSPKVAGVLKNLLVEQGDRVQAGQIIAKMDDADLQAQLIQVRAKLAQAQAELAQARAGNRIQEIDRAQAQVDAAQARANFAREKLERYRRLTQQGAIAQNELDQYVSESQSAQANLREAQRQLSLLKSGSRPEEIAQRQAVVQAAQGELQALQVKLNDTIIRAPFTGLVTQKNASEGAFVTPTTSASSGTSSSNSSLANSTSIVVLAKGLEVLAEVPEVDVGQIKSGQQVEIVADSYPDRIFKGHVRLVAPEAVVDQNVTSFQVRVALDSGTDKLLSGMNVDLTFLGQNLNDALVVPTVSIVTQEGKTGVLVPGEKNKPEFRPVTIGSSIQDQTQILQGLKQGDRVFLDLPKDQQPEQESE